MTWVFDHSPYKLGPRLVHLALADSANDANSSLLWATQAEIAAKAGVSRATVNSTLQTMVGDGWLDEVTGEDAAMVRSLMADSRAKVFRFRTTCRESDTSGEPMCQVDAARCVKSTELHLLPTQELTQARADDPMRGFLLFWDTYPRRNGRRLGRKPTTALWVKLSLEDRRAAYHGAVAYAEAIAKGETIAKDPERFLKHRIWEDWLEPAELPPPPPATETTPEVEVDHEAPGYGGVWP
jgi:DNA-binding MarR family transcriptional regulator